MRIQFIGYYSRISQPRQRTIIFLHVRLDKVPYGFDNACNISEYEFYVEKEIFISDV